MRLGFLGLVATLALAQYASADMSFSVNETAAMNVAKELVDFGTEYMTKTSGERAELMSQLCDAFKNTGAKLLLNFGKTIAPLVEEWAEMMKKVQINKDCDQECAASCLDPKARATMFFDTGCLKKCNCKLDLDKAGLAKESVELAKYAKDAGGFLSSVLMENYQKVKPALQDYLAKEAELHADFGKLLKKTAEETFQCDTQCITDCLKHDFVTFWEIPKCVRHCDCKQSILKIDGGNENIPELILYSDYDKQAWAFLQLHQAF